MGAQARRSPRHATSREVVGVEGESRKGAGLPGNLRARQSIRTAAHIRHHRGLGREYRAPAEADER